MRLLTRITAALALAPLISARVIRYSSPIGSAATSHIKTLSSQTDPDKLAFDEALGNSEISVQLDTTKASSKTYAGLIIKVTDGATPRVLATCTLGGKEKVQPCSPPTYQVESVFAGEEDGSLVNLGFTIAHTKEYTRKRDVQVETVEFATSCVAGNCGTVYAIRARKDPEKEWKGDKVGL